MNKLNQKWNVMSTAAKLYFVANAILPISAVGLWFTLPNPNPLLFAALALPTLLLTVAGFLSWLIPIMRRGPIASGWKLLAIGVQAVLIPLCVSMARIVVTAATGLPGQSFDITVALLAVVFVPFAWSVVAATLALFSICFSGIFFTIWDCLHNLVRPFVVPWSLKMGTIETQRQKAKETSNHVAGFFMTSMLFLLGCSAYIAFVCDQDFVRLMAYALDFSPMEHYPGVESGRHAKLLDNGLIAYAHRTGFDITITVDKWKFPGM